MAELQSFLEPGRFFCAFGIVAAYTPAYGYTLGKGGEGSLDEGSRYG